MPVAQEAYLLLSFKAKCFGMSFEALDKFCSPSHLPEAWNLNLVTIAYNNRTVLPRPLARPTLPCKP